MASCKAGAKEKKMLEPRVGVEPTTCRLRQRHYKAPKLMSFKRFPKFQLSSNQQISAQLLR